MSSDQSPAPGSTEKTVQQFQTGNVLPQQLPHAPADREELPITDTDIVSLAMRQFYQSPANAAG